MEDFLFLLQILRSPNNIIANKRIHQIKIDRVLGVIIWQCNRDLCSYFTEDVVVTAAVMAILVSVSSEPVDDFLVLTPLTLLLSITVEVLSGGVKTLVSTVKNYIVIINKKKS